MPQFLLDHYYAGLPKNDLEKFNCWENPGENIRNGQDVHSTVNYSYELYNCR
ncbi:MAG: hypothetical protein F6K54_20020 [Okeania sp. SIO3B5]|uniref:hypothetical protein n=1 Tax=Okeania sp. SIO3B5 TaxID=2607811 RepID=UPI001400AF5E|nr:hypothetical protein [Okeania sp. SIO3B5]NEO55160.1 hypothetical protein [Okeania sp. SIO3B5]